MKRSTQASRVLARFGGAFRLASILREMDESRTVTTLYRWTYPRSKGGTGGLIPGESIPLVLEAARRSGVKITHADWSPEER